MAWSKKQKFEKRVFERICGCRFSSLKEIKEWMSEQMGEQLQNLVVPGKSPLYDKEDKTDFFMDCCVDSDDEGETDFTLYYLLDHERNFYITEICWS